MPKKKKVKKASKKTTKKAKKKSANSKSNDKNNKNNKNGTSKLTLGQRLADKLTLFAGSWRFIIGFLVFLIIWMILNLIAFVKHWDPYPFILLNLVLSCLAAIQAPIILMSQNRAAERDRHKAELDYIVNRKAEREVTNMQQDLEDIKHMIKYIHHKHKDKKLKEFLKRNNK
ncbi:DUF1003 domain-containing protein [Candidatus Woesearchaeota archaeon]|nr:DUF1003 domain-containing protein [Candidatus Woesearchaeota archaeon]